MSIIRLGLQSGLCLCLLLAGCTTNQESMQDATAESPATVVAPASELSDTDSAPPESTAVDTTTEEEMLWQKLAQAEEETYVVLLRHAIAPGTGDPTNFQLDDCSTQRNLSEAGRQQAKAIGEAFWSRNIPVVEVLSSQWCRCLETAELMDVGLVKPFAPLNSFFRDRSTADAQIAQLKDYIATSQDRPGVIVMVTHQVNITALSDIFPQSGSAVVMQLNEGQLDVLGQLSEPGS